MFASVIKGGLGITVHNTLVNTWITVQVTHLLLYIMNENFSLELKLSSQISQQLPNQKKAAYLQRGKNVLFVYIKRKFQFIC